jgi:CheY-like chemotaxis protein
MEFTMSALKISVCQYPTTTLILDDNEDFVTQLGDLLQSKHIPSRLFSDPRKALDFLNQEYKADPFTNHCVKTYPDRDLDTYISHLDIRKIHHEIYNSNRFSQISVLCVDYAMPSINGLDFCKQINDEFSLKLILTGDAGPTFAIDAFNEHAIDKFVQKGAIDLPELIVKSVRELQQRYFLKLSEAVLNKVNQRLYNQAPSCLTDENFAVFFNQLCEKNQIVEYYLLDESGSFLLLDKNAVPSWLLVKSEKDMHDLYEFAEIQGNTPSDILNGFKNKTLLSYFHTEEDFHIGYDNEKCRSYLHPATPLKGEKQSYYYSYIIKPEAYQIDRTNIFSFEKYRENG